MKYSPKPSRSAFASETTNTMASCRLQAMLPYCLFVLLLVPVCLFALSWHGSHTASAASANEMSIGIAMHGEPKLAGGFSHFPYVNSAAPKGGSITYGVVGTFNNTNPFILKSMRTTARGIWDPQFGNLVYETLMTRSRDEPFSLYGLIAEKVVMPDDRKWIEFFINPLARWADGKPITPQDVKFSFEVLRDKGRPPFSSRMERIEKIEITGEHQVKFTFNEQSDREFPLIVAMTPILPAHAIKADTFDRSTLNPPLGSGPYSVSAIDAGKSITFTRNKDYWGKNLPTRIGTGNFDTVKVEYYLQPQTLFEAFQKGLIDVYPEGDPAHWQRAYHFPAVTDGKVIKDEFHSGQPANMLAFVFNTRRSIFADPKTREALALLFDFEWVNRNLYFGLYKRTASFWQGSQLSALGHPASAAERQLLGDSTKQIPQAILSGEWRPPVTNGSGHDRKVMRLAYEKLAKAGYTTKNGRLSNAKGQPLRFEILCKNKEEENLAIAYARTLDRIGVKVEIRTVDDSQYQSRTQVWDYDMRLATYTASLSPGAEQIARWGSSSRDVDGTFNYAGTADPAIDRMIEALLAAHGEEEFTDAVRALDRLLLAGNYVVPLFHLDGEWIARWARIQRPEVTPLYGAQMETWWSQNAR